MDAYAAERHCDASAVFQIVDLTASSDMTPTASGSASLSQIAQVKNGVVNQTYKLATLEKDYLKLDGSAVFVDSGESHESGWWSSAISDDSGVIDATLTLTFGSAHSAYGLTIYFDDKAKEVVSDYTITAYNSSGTAVATKTVTGNASVISGTVLGMTNFTKIVVHFTKTAKPHRRVRVTEVVCGIVEYFDRNSISSLKMIREISGDSSALPISEVQLTFDNSNQRYNMANPAGAFAYLKTGLPLTVKLGCGASDDTIEMADMGTFYYNTSNSDDDALTATITAQDVIQYMEKVPYTVPSGTTTTLAAMTTQINASLGMTLTWSLDSSVSATSLTNYATDSNVTCRQALQEACQALKCVCYVNRLGVVTVKPLAVGTVKEILNKDKLVTVPKITTEEHINKVVASNGDTISGTYTDKGSSEVLQEKDVSNSLLTSALASGVAQWLLKLSRRYKYTMTGRGNPERDLADTVTVVDAFGTNHTAMVTKHTIEYDGGISEEIEAVSEEA